MQQFDQDWLELGFRVAKAMHYQTRWARSYMEQAAIEAEERPSARPRNGDGSPVDPGSNRFCDVWPEDTPASASHTRVTLLPGDQHQRRLHPARLQTGLFP